jgi:nucleoside-diphosphate-sugar epimerase
MASVCVTGATGFVGSRLVQALKQQGHVICPISFRESLATKRFAVMSSCETLIHTAARVHVMKDVAADPLSDFRNSNSTATVELARNAALAGVKRFIFISSIKVNGESTDSRPPFSAEDAPSPLDFYGISKMEAEQGLAAVAAQTGMQVVIIRPPLVYGPGVKANFRSMMRWLRLGIPLPFGAIHNERSLVSLDNLVDLLVTCVAHPAAANQTFLVSDGEDLSTTQLLTRMGLALEIRTRLLPVPASVIRWGAALVGKADIAQRLCCSLQVDISKTRQLLDWDPPVSVDQGLRKAAEGYLRETAV